jgi:hypothetical protein
MIFSKPPSTYSSSYYFSFILPIVKAKVDTIKMCGMKVGKQAAHKSGGLFSEEDWICSK